MSATAPAALIAEFEGAVDSRSPKRWIEIMRQVTSLFLAEAHRLNEGQIAIFDEVFLRLMERTDAQALAHLSDNLSGISAAPRKAIRRLAFHHDVLVAGAVLRRSKCLLDTDLVEIANARGEQHLLEISSRQTVSASLSDKLVERGETAVLPTRPRSVKR